MLWPLERAAEIMRWYREFITTASEEINGFFAFLIVPPGPPFPEHLHLKNMCGIVWCYAGALDKAEEIFKPIRDVFASGARFRRANTASCSPDHVRRPFSSRTPMVLEV